jgi:hypothetical protein
MEDQPGPTSSSAPASLDMATSVSNPDQVIALQSTSQVAGATVDSPPVDFSNVHLGNNPYNYILDEQRPEDMSRVANRALLNRSCRKM